MLSSPLLVKCFFGTDLRVLIILYIDVDKGRLTTNYDKTVLVRGNDWIHNKPAQLLPVPWKCIMEMTRNLTNIDPISKRSNSGSRRATEVLKKRKIIKI